MSDGQAYLLLLAALYLVETCAFGPPGSLLLTSFLGRKFTPRDPVLPMGGIRKSLFFKPLLPAFPVSLFLPPPGKETLSTPTPASVARRRRLVLAATANLRIFSFIIFLLFFFATPLVYFFRGDSPLTNLLIIYGYGLMLLNGIQYFCLHRRLLPRTGLWTESLFCAFLPWHSMRAADHLITAPSRHVHPLSTLLSLPDSPKRNALLNTFWRELEQDCIDPRLSSWFQNRGLDPADLVPAPTADSPDATQYCPRCLATFTAAAETCSDCTGTSLVPLE